ncbi:MAG: hypothetical protein ABH859_07555 [Pseudomonadota bacterium]
MSGKLVNLIIFTFFLIAPALSLAAPPCAILGAPVKVVAPSPPVAPAPAVPCHPVDISEVPVEAFSCAPGEKINIDIITLQAELNDFEEHDAGLIYKYCYKIIGDTPLIADVLFINNPACPKPIYINGLELSIDPTAPAGLTILTINNITHGLRMDQSELHGHDSGTGIRIDRSNNVTIQSSNLVNLHTGIQIENSNNVLLGVTSPDMLDKQNTFENSEIGINLISGSRVRYPINRYINVGQALQVDLDLGFIAPILLTNVYDDEAAATEDVLKCKTNEETGEVESWLEIENAEPGDEIIVYRDIISGGMREDISFNKNYLTVCRLDIDNKCFISFPDDIELSSDKCGNNDLRGDILINLPSSSLFSSVGRLYNKKGPTNIGSELGGIDIPGPGVTESSAGSDDEFIDDEEEGGGSNLSGQVELADSGSDLGGSSIGSAATSKMSCTLQPTTNSTRLPAIIILLPLLLLFTMRHRRNSKKGGVL